MKTSFRDVETGDFYTIDFVWKRDRFSFFTNVGHFEMFVVSRPECSYPQGQSAHLLDRDQICVRDNNHPTTIDRAKAIAMHWLKGFSTYRRTGTFPNGAVKVNVA